MPVIPRTMSTQNPDNATIPPFCTVDVLSGEDEILEAYLLFSQLGCQEQMWDFEGKKAVPWVVSELLAKPIYPGLFLFAPPFTRSEYLRNCWGCIH